MIKQLEMPPLRDFWVIPVFVGSVAAVVCMFLIMVIEPYLYHSVSNVFYHAIVNMFTFFSIWALIGSIWMIIDFIIDVREGTA